MFFRKGFCSNGREVADSQREQESRVLRFKQVVKNCSTGTKIVRQW